MMGSRRFVEVFEIQAFWRLGVRDLLFEDELLTERDNVARSSLTRAKKRILKLSQESRGEKKRKPNSNHSQHSGDGSAASSSNDSETDERPLSLLFSNQPTDAAEVEVISDKNNGKNADLRESAAPLTIGPTRDNAAVDPVALNAPRLLFRTRSLRTRIRQFVAARRHSMQLLFEKQDTAALLHTATRLHQHLVRQGEQAQMVVEGLKRLAAWRVYSTFPDDVFRVNGKRVGIQQEQAAFNWARHLPADIILVARFVHWANGILGEVSRWLGRSPSNRLTPIDLWHRLQLNFDITGRMDSRLLELTGHELTIVVAAGLPDAMFIIQLLRFQAQKTVSDAGLEPDASMVLHVKFADLGVLDLQKIAIRFGSQTKLLDDFVPLAKELEQMEREPFEGQIALARQAMPTHRFITLFGPLVQIERLITHVEWSCSDAVANMLRGARKIVRLTNSINAWREHNTNKWLKLLLQFRSCCSTFEANIDDDTVKLRKEKLINAFRDLAVRAGVIPMDEPPNDTRSR